jgi:arylsulfatase A-like enzyme
MPNDKRPNVVIFMLDTQRADRLSCYGHDRKTTPCIDALADEGAVFLENVSPSIWTLPSVASMMTGLHSHSHGAGSHNDSFSDEHTTLAEILAASGYRTIAFYANSYCEMSSKGFRETHRPPDVSLTVDEQHELSRDRVRRASHWIEENHLEDGQPFFMFVQLMDPHLPAHPPEEFKTLMPSDATDEEAEAIDQDPFDLWACRSQLTDRQYALLKSMVDGETAFADGLVGKLADAMRERGVLDDTVFIVTSDHGDMFGEQTNDGVHDQFTHHLCVYEPLIKTPLVARYPAAFPAGSRVEHPTQTLDIAPTLAELIGFDAPQFQGHSLLSALGDKPERAFTLTEYMKSTHVAARLLTRYDPTMDVRLYLRWLKAWRRDGWKYIWTSDRRDELYFLKEDPGETNNLIEREPAKANELRIEMEDYLASLPCGWRGDLVATGRCSEESVARLRGLEFFHDR